MNKKFSLCLFWLSIFFGCQNTLFATENSLDYNSLPADTIFTDDLGTDALDSWTDTIGWISDGSLIKHNLEGVAGKSYLSAKTDGLYTNGTTTWTFRLSFGYEATTTNKFGYWLMASKADLSDGKTSGYVVGACMAGSEKNLLMCRIDANGTKTVLYKTRYLWNTPSDVKVIVTRTAKGCWTLSYIVNPETSTDTIVGDDFIDNTFSDLQYHGYFFNYSKTRAGQLWVGNTSILRQASPITLLPTVWTDGAIVEAEFTGFPDSLSATTAANYTIDGKAVAGVQLDDAVPQRVIIKTNGLAAGTHTLAVSGVIGRNGLTMEPQQIEFEFIPPAKPFDLVFNELMYNPSGADLPNYDYLELYNNSQSNVRLGGWILDISGTIRQLPDSTINSGEYLIITTAAAADTFRIFGKAVGAITSSHLTNTGRTLRLVSPQGLTIDSLTYTEKSVLDAEKNGGWSLERIDPKNTCSGWKNWAFSTDLRGGTPGQRNSVYANNIDNTPVRITNLIPVSGNTVQIEFSEIPPYNSMTAADNYRWGPRRPGGFSFEDNKLAVRYGNYFKSDYLQEIKIVNITDECGNVMKDTTIQFIYHQTQLYDLVISEIMANPEPSAGLPENEWIELYNRTDFDIHLNDFIICIGSKHYAIDDGTIGAKSYAILTKTGNEDNLRQYGNVVTVSKMPALAQSASITIFDADVNPVCGTDYKQNWFADDLKAAGGYSLERIDVDNADESAANWAQTENRQGGTPGSQNSISQSIADTVKPQLIRVVPANEKTLQLFFSEPVIVDGLAEKISLEPAGCPAYYAQPSDQNLSMAVVRLDGELSENEIYTLTIDSTLTDIAGNRIGQNTATFALSQKVESNDLVISEILFNPYPNGSDFVEIYNRSDHPVNIAGLVLASRVDGNLKNPKNIDRFGSILLPNSYIAISTDIANIAATYNHGELYQVSALPSMPDDEGNIVLADTSGNVFDEVPYSSKMHFGLLKDLNGVSLERIDFEQPADNPGNWHSASELVGWATPGLPNSASRTIKTDGDALISLNNETFSPDNDGFEDQLEISYNVEEAGYVASVTIFNANGLKIRTLANNELIGTSGFWAWDGLDSNNRKVPIGIYVIYCELFDLDGNVKKAKKVCVVSAKM